jgi:hypothetical protein
MALLERLRRDGSGWFCRDRLGRAALSVDLSFALPLESIDCFFFIGSRTLEMFSSDPPPPNKKSPRVAIFPPEA